MAFPKTWSLAVRFLPAWSLTVLLMTFGCSFEDSAPSSPKSLGGSTRPSEAATEGETETTTSGVVTDATTTPEVTTDAEVVYQNALAKASKDNKRVLVHFGAPW